MIVSESRTQTLPENQTKPTLSLEGGWHVVMLNDPVNLASYVVLVLRRIFGFDDTRAQKHMRECHEGGRSVLWTGAREKAEAYVYSLQEWHLSAVLERDESH
jgi:ATP-dependent Clp protease adaptor protein ClpS